MRRVLFVTIGAVLLVLAGGTAAMALARQPPTLTPSSEALARIALPRLGGRIESVRVTTPDGAAVPVSVRDDGLWPQRPLRQGLTLRVRLTVRRPGWAEWLLGDTVTRSFTVATPVLHVRTRFLHVGLGDVVTIPLDTPAARVSIDHRAARLAAPAVQVRTGVVATGTRSAGSVEIAAAPRVWERLGEPVRVSWFPRLHRQQLVALPESGAQVAPQEHLTLTFSSPVAGVLADRPPRLRPATPGRWRMLDTHTIAFEPTGLGLPLGAAVYVTLPATIRASLPGRTALVRTLVWHVEPGSPLRLLQLLGGLGYLPLAWEPRADRLLESMQGQLRAALSPPAGTFAWRYRNTPAELRSEWIRDRATVVQGAVMRFEDEHGLPVDGVAGPAVWRALFTAAIAGTGSSGGYSYVFVHETVPQSLTLWHDGRIVVRSPGNTGIAQAPTAPGTYPVFEHIPVGTMEGTNPDGSHYRDPGVQWISYFHGGDAIHAFPRASYGTPQSLGCVELPTTAAAKVWPFTPVGTLVTVGN
jgi:L,D-transpeptidase catalytic domain/Putative peptidoglycan binding domain